MSPPAYKYAIKDCHVEDKCALEAFREKRRQWLDWLRYDEHHAISLHIASLVWNDVVFRTLARVGAMNEGGALGNSLIAEALIDGHFAVQTLAIRRLMDRTRSVISLVRLLDDIATRIELLTRENFVAFDGLPYDYEAARQRMMVAQLAAKGPVWAARDGPDAWLSAQRAHEMFDRLSGVDAANRQRQDRISRRHIRTLQQWLENSDAKFIVDWTNSSLAHAAVRTGRVGLATIQLTLDKVTAVSRTFVRVSEAISAYLLFDSGHGAIMPVPQFPQFKQLDRPVIALEQVPEVEMLWNTLAKERDGFLANVIEDMMESNHA